MIRFLTVLLSCVGIIAQSAYPLNVGGTTDLVALTPGNLKTVLLTNDGGGAFRWDRTSLLATNATTVFKPLSLVTGRWIAISPVAGITLSQIGASTNGKLDSTNGVSVGLTNTATGSTVARGIDDRFAETKNVLDYGATGNGTTDDTLAIRAAITAAGVNGRLDFPAGKTFVLGGWLGPLAGQEWIGNGAILKRCNEVTESFSTAITTGVSPTVITVVSTNGFFVGMDVSVFNGSDFDPSTHRIAAMTATTLTLGTVFSVAFPSGGTVVSAFPQIINFGDRVVIDGFEFNGNSSGNTALNKWQTHTEITSTGDDVVIRNNYLHDCPSEGLEIGGENPLVTHNRIENCQGNGIHLAGAAHAIISYNMVRHVNLSGTGTGHADGCIIASNLVGDTLMVGNYVEDGISGFGSFDSVDNSRLSIVDNTITNFATYAIEMALPTGVTVYDATFKGNKFYNAGTVFISNNSADYATTNGPKKIIFEGNTLTNTTLTATLVQGLSIVGNLFSNSGTNNAVLNIYDSKDVIVSGNPIEGGGYGIYVSGQGSGTNTENVSISGNILRNQYLIGISMARTGMVNVVADGNLIIAKTNIVNPAWYGILVNDGSVAMNNVIHAEDGAYGIQMGLGASGAYSRAYNNKITLVNTAMSSIITFAGSSNAYVFNNFVSKAVSDAGGSPPNMVFNNPLRGDPLGTGTGVLVASVAASLTNALAWNRLSIIDGADTAATNHMINAVSGAMYLTSKGTLILRSSDSALRIDSAPGTAPSYINFYDSLNNTNAQIRTTQGYLTMAPANGSVFRVQNYAGSSTWFQVNGTDGLTYFAGSGLSANTVPYLGASGRFMSSAVTPTELGYLSGVTLALQTQLNAKAPLADPVFTGSLQLPNAAAPTTDAFGEIAGDNNAWAASRGAVQAFDGTANTWLVGVLASDAPSNGQVPTWNTGGTITWEAAGGGSAPTGNGFARVTSGVYDAAGVELSGDVSTSGSGVVTLATVPVAKGGTGLTAVPGATTQLIQNLAGVYSADAGLTYDPATDHFKLLHSPAANTVPTVGFELENPESASSGNQEYSPIFWLTGQGWKTTATAASQQVRFGFYVQTTQGSSAPTGRLKIVQQIAGGAVTEVGEITSGGSYTATATLNGASVVSSASVQAGSSSQFVWNGRSMIRSSANGAIEFFNAAVDAMATIRGNTAITNITANTTLVALHGGFRINNTGASAKVGVTMPAAAVGYSVNFFVTDADGFDIIFVGDDTVQYGTTLSGAAPTLTSTATGSWIRLYASSTTLWEAEIGGTWTP